MNYHPLSLEILDKAIALSPRYEEQLRDVRALIRAKAPKEEVSLVFGPIVSDLEEGLSSVTRQEFDEYCGKIEKATGLEFKPERGLRVEGKEWRIENRKYPDFMKTDVLFYLLNSSSSTFNKPKGIILGKYSPVTDQTFVLKASPHFLQREISVEEATHSLIDRELGYTGKLVEYFDKAGLLPLTGEIEAELFDCDLRGSEFSKAHDKLKEKYPNSIINFIIFSLGFGMTTDNKEERAKMARVGINYNTYLEAINFAEHNRVMEVELEEIAKAVSIRTLKSSDEFYDNILALDETIFKNREDLNFERALNLAESENAIRNKIASMKK